MRIKRMQTVGVSRDELLLANYSTRRARLQRKLCRQILSSYVKQNSLVGAGRRAGPIACAGSFFAAEVHRTIAGPGAGP